MRHKPPEIVIEHHDLQNHGVTVNALANAMMKILSTDATTANKERTEENPRGKVITGIVVNPENEISVFYKVDYVPNYGDQDFLQSLLLRAAGQIRLNAKTVSSE